MFRTLLIIVLLGSAIHAAEAGKPNIVLVFIDDMGWADLSCFGNAEARTSRIDRMAAEGIAFEQFYVNAPICSPSRVAISTGQYPQRWRITSYLAQRQRNVKRGLAQWLDPEAPMLARRLHRAGYMTGHFGKWHMGGQRDVDNAPPITDYGFDRSLTNFEGMGPKLLPATARPGKDGEVKTGRIWTDAERLGGPVTWMQRSRITGGFVDAAVAFIDQAVDAGKPFYVNVWPDDVHSPFFPPIQRWGDGEKRTLYLAVLEAMDRQFGRLFDRIRDDPALRDNTLVLICSDNGPELGAGRAAPLKGYKTHLCEGGIRSPLIAWGPGLIDDEIAGTRNDQSVFAAIDLVPSLLALAGLEPDADTFDGENMLDTLLGRSTVSRDAPICFSRPPDRKNFYGFKNLPDLAVRDGRWKLLCDEDGSRPELYDLEADPGETDNRAASHPAVVNRLYGVLRDWADDVDLHQRPAVDLDAIQSPIIFRGDATTAYRDPTAIRHDDVFHLYFTLVEIEPDGEPYSYLAASRSRDLVHWTEPRKLTPRDQNLNYGSPGNIVRFDGQWVLCLQTYPRPNGEPYGNASARIWIMRSDDLKTWSAPELLRVKGPDVPRRDMGRMIDPYLLRDMHDPGKWWCFYKQRGVSRSWSRDLQTWHYDGRVEGGENVCVLIDGGEYVMFHAPPNGIGVKRSDDLKHWRDQGVLTFGQKQWPWARGRLTAGFVLDERHNPDIAKALMFFHGSDYPEKDPRGGFDNFASLGLAWSDDLRQWTWPGR